MGIDLGGGEAGVAQLLLDAGLTAANEALKKAEGELADWAAAALDDDPAGKKSYQAAEDARGDTVKLDQVIQYYSGGALYTPEEIEVIQGYEKELQAKYGLKPQDFMDFAQGQMPQAIQDASAKMEAAFRESKEALEATGPYDFRDMRGYAERMEQQKKREQANEENARLADEHPVEATAGTFLASPFRFFDLLSTDWGRGEPEDPDYIPPSNGPGIGDAVDTVRGTVAQGIKKKFKDQEWLGNALSFLYQTGMSTVDSAATVATLGPGSVYLMGTNAAVGEARGIIDRGGTADQALAGGLAAGAAEVIFEKVSVENLLKPKNITGWRSWVKETLKQGGIEASEEICTEIANIFSDTAIMGEKSEFNMAVAAYQLGGMSPEEAKRRAYLDMVGQVALAGAGGFISGTAMGGIKGGYEAVRAGGQNMGAVQVEKESTAIDTDPEGHTPEQQAVIQEYQSRTDETLKEVFQGYLDNPKQGFSRHNISNVSQRQAQDAQRLLGGTYEGYRNAINSNGIQHILGEHGPEGTVDQSLGDLNDIARMGYVLDHYDDVEVVTYESGDTDFSSEFRDKNDRPAPMLKFSKRVDGTYYVVEAIPEAKHQKFWVVSAYMENAEGGTQAPDAQGPRNTPNASLASSPSAETSIPQTAQDVNLEVQAAKLERGIAELDRQKVERGTQGLGIQGQATVKAMYLEGQSAGDYVQGMRELYAAGQAGVAIESVESEAVQSLNGHQRRAAYEAGQMDAKEELPFYFGSEKGANSHEQAGELRVRDGGQWADGAGAQGTVGGVEEGAGGNLAGADRAGPADTGAGALQVGRAVSSYDLGIAGGLTTDSVQVVTGGETEAVRAARAEAKRYGAELVLFTGGNLHVQIETEQGERIMVEARGYIKGKKVYVRADHAEHTAYQLWRHELYHALTRAGKVSPEETMLAVRRELGPELTARLEAAYSTALGGIEGVELWEEIAADQYGGMNIFSDTVLEGEMEALGLLVGTKTDAQKANSQTAQATDQRTGPPQGKQTAAEREPGGGGKASIERLPDGRSYVKADRPVIFGQDTESWRVQLENYINEKIRNEQDVQLIGTDGDVLTLTAETAGKISSPFRGDGTRLSDAEYERKVNAGAHIDELAQVSRSQGKTKRDAGGRHGEFASQGWDYRDAYFQDFDGKYYRVHISAAIGNDGKIVYNIGQMQERSLPTVDGSSAIGGAPRGEKASLESSIPQQGAEVKGDFSLEPSGYVKELREQRAELEEQSRQEGWSPERMEEEVRAAVQSALQSLVDKYGTIKPGERRAREVQVPKKTGKRERVSQTVRTILEAGATSEAAVPTIEELTVKGDFSYQVLSDKTAIERAEQAIRHKGWGASLADWFQTVKSGAVSKDNTAMGWALYNQAANSGDIQTAMDIIQSMVLHQRNAAQAVQATRILKQMDPETQLYGVQRSVAGLQEELNRRFGDDKAPKLVISQELAEQLLAATDQEGRDRVMQAIYWDIGRQMPSSFADKWNAWRYLSMLGNVRTHVRNIMGNAGFAPVVAVKNMTATAIERAVCAVSGGRLERSKAMVGLGAKGRGLLAAAWGDYAKVQDAAMGGGKYSEFQNANKYIEEGRIIFGGKLGKPLETARKANSKALDAEDMWFSKPHYAYAMAQYCAAHGITEETIRTGDAKALDKAREYAIREAQKATYRDTNALPQLLGGLGRDLRRSSHATLRGAGMVVEGVLPFRKTPANILARGLEYSPLGLMKGLSYDLAQVKAGNMTGAEAIDNISAGLTGTGLLTLGVYLAAQGVLRGKGVGDDKEKELQKLQGHQDYSLEIGDVSVTLDWLAPEALPLFVGANLWETMQEDGDVTMSDMLSTVSNVSDPLLKMSCLQSLNDIFDSVGYASQNETNPLTSVLVSSATSYLTQGLPTIFGQGERVFETQRESTYTSRDAFLTGDMQYFLGKVSGKVPGWEFQQVPYVDAWGRTEDTGGLGQRAVNNLLNPAYVSEVKTSPMEEELVRLYNATGENVFPSRAAKYFQVKGERRDLSPEEYVDYATQKGQTARKTAEALVKNARYRGLEDGEKAEAIADVYKYAEQTARQAVAKDYEPDSWVVRAQTAQKSYKVPVETYILLRNQCAGLGSIKDKNGEAIANSKGLQIMEVVYAVPGLGDKQRGYLFEALGVGESIRHYNKKLVEEKLRKMRK